MFEGLEGDDIYVDGVLVARLVPGLTQTQREAVEDKFAFDAEAERKEIEAGFKDEIRSLENEVRDAHEKIDALEIEIEKLDGELTAIENELQDIQEAAERDLPN